MSSHDQGLFRRQHGPDDLKNQDLGDQPELRLDRFVRLALRLTGSNVALVGFLEGDHLRVWSSIGVAGPDQPCTDLPHRDCACQRVISRQHVTIPDTTELDDEQSCELVARMGVRSFLGVPVAHSGDQAGGLLAVGSTEPHTWTAEDVAALNDLATIVTDELERAPDHSEGAESVQDQQERLRESELRKRAVFEAALDCIITIDHQGCIVEFNAAAERTFGYSREYAIGRLMADLIMPPEYRDACMSAFAHHLQSGESSVLGTRTERPAMRSDGTIIQTEMAVTRIDLPGQRAPLFTAYLRDITDRKQAERDILVFKHMVDAVGQAVVANDLDQRITYWNKAAEQILGWTADEALGRNVSEVLSVPGAEEQMHQIGQYVRNGDTWSGEFSTSHRDGFTVPVLAHVAPLLDDDNVLVGVLAALTDLSDIKETEREILLYKHIVDGVGESVVASDMDRRIFYANRAAEKALGWSIDDVRGMDIRDVVPAQDYRDQSTEIGRAVRETGERRTSEFMLRRTDGETFPALVSLAPIVGDTEEVVGTIGIYTDISELKRTEHDLRFHKHAIDAVGQALIANDFDRCITYWNNAAEEMLGWTAEEVIGRRFSEVVPAESNVSLVREIGARVRRGETWRGELLLKHRDGRLIPTLSSVRPIKSEDGKIIAIIGAHSDLTEIKATQQDLLFHKQVVSTVEQPLIANDMDGRVTYFNKAAEELLGWTSEEMLGKVWVEVGPAEEIGEDIPRISAQVRSGASWFGESGLKKKDGTFVPVIKHISPAFDEDGNVIHIIGAYTDISELRRREEDVRFFKHIVEAIGEAVVATSMDGEITWVNSAAERMLGWESSELVGRTLISTIPAQSLLTDAQEISRFVRTGRAWFGEFPLQRKDGSVFPALVSVAPVTDETGATTGIISVYSEISELKRAEDENRFFKNVVDAVGQVVIANDLDRNITYWNNAAEEILGWKAEEVVGIDAATVAPTPDFLPSIPEITRVVRSGGTWHGEFMLQHRDGSVIPALSALKPIQNEDGKIIGVLGAHTDIRELKQTEAELRFHKHIVDAVGQAVVVSDVAGRITYWNKAAEEIYGWTWEEAIGKTVYDLLPADSDRDRAENVTDTVASGQTWAGESLVRRKDGTEFPAYFTVSPIRDTGGEIVGIIGVSHDISDQKEYERQIEFHKIMLDAVGQTIVTTDMNRVITYWSKGAEQALGWTAEEVLGRPIANIAPAAHLKEEAGKLHKAVREGQTWTGEFPIRRKDGSTFPAVVNLAPVQLAGQGTVGVIGVYTDIAELKQTEDELRLHKHMLDAVGQAVFATDDQFRVTYVNRAAEELYGHGASQAIGAKFLDFIPPDSEGLLQARHALEIVMHEGSWTGEMVTYNSDGAEITALVSASMILGEDSRQVGLVVALADISARRRVEEALQESNERVTEILETMGEGFISLDREWCIQYVNPQAENILCRHRDDLLGKDFWVEFPEPEDEPFYRAFVEAFETRQSVEVTAYDPHLEMWLEVQASPSHDQLSVFFRDVTERHARETALREAEERYRTLVEQLPAMTYIASPNDLSNLTYVSPQIESMLGYESSLWLESTDAWVERLHPDDRDRVLAEDARTIAEGHDRFVLEYRLRAADGTYHWLRDSAMLIRDINGEPSYWQGLSYDITDVKRSERTIRESEQRFRSLFDNHPEAVFSINHNGRLLSANPTFESMTGFSMRDSSPLLFVDLVVDDDRDRVLHMFEQTHAGKPQDFRTAITDPHGKRIELNLTTIPIVVDEDIVGVHVVAQDVTTNQELERRLAHQAYHDSLTDLPNRNLFQSRLAQRLERAYESGDQFAVLFFDLDDFKVINDSLGHSAGDGLLIEVARRVQTCIRSNDLLARLGGDEFTLLLEHVSDDQDAVLIAERIASVLDQPFEIEGHEVFATTSIGIAIGGDSSPGTDDILRNADLAMYEAKNLGKNRYAIFEPSMNSRAWLRLTLETEIRRGIPRDEFVVYYQPIVDLYTGELEGVEALVRWNHPDRGFLTPKDFISVAEQSGLILPLGRWIMWEASSRLREWQSLRPDGKPLRLSLNLSPKQYQHPRLIEELTRTLRSLDFDPSLITLEITESIAMDDSLEMIHTLQKLKDVGVQLALDDFGTGFSALSYLRRFPIDIIKIDQSFISGLGLDAEDTSIVRAVMAASLAMKLKVTAEGVETVDQLQMLRELGCELGQGYLFAQALTPEEMHRIISEGQYSWRPLFSESAVSAEDDA